MRRVPSERGLTVLELLIMLMILGILGSLVVYAVAGQLGFGESARSFRSDARRPQVGNGPRLRRRRCQLQQRPRGDERPVHRAGRRSSGPPAHSMPRRLEEVQHDAGGRSLDLRAALDAADEARVTLRRVEPRRGVDVLATVGAALETRAALGFRRVWEAPLVFALGAGALGAAGVESVVRAGHDVGGRCLAAISR